MQFVANLSDRLVCAVCRTLRQLSVYDVRDGDDDDRRFAAPSGLPGYAAHG